MKWSTTHYPNIRETEWYVRLGPVHLSLIIERKRKAVKP